MAYSVCKSKEIYTDLFTLKNWRKYLGVPVECDGFFKLIYLIHKDIKENTVMWSFQVRAWKESVFFIMAMMFDLLTSNITNVTSKLLLSQFCVPVSPQRGYLDLTFKGPNTCLLKDDSPSLPPTFSLALISVNSQLVTTCCCAVACPCVGACICALLAFPGLAQSVEKLEITPCWRTVTLVLKWKELRS